MKKVFFILLFMVLPIPLFAQNGEEKELPKKIECTVETTSGPVMGDLSDSIHVFKGIPYAASPVGKLRWKAPRSPEPWKEPRLTKEFGPSCPQYEDELTKGRISKMDEDCLYLNVWTPAKTEADGLPVMVWIHGGGFLIGSGSLPFYEGGELSKAGVVVVTINYRLGRFGFFAHPELSAESEHNVSGNYGILDQIFALKWVRDNIGKFGGDPGSVTIFGESAGGVSVCALIATPLAKGLFQRAICQSAGAPHNQPHLKKNTGSHLSAESQGLEFAKKLGVKNEEKSLEALRKIPWRKILETDATRIVLPGGQPQLNIDGYVFPDEILAIIEKGKGTKIPLIIGTNKDEGTMFAKRIGINTKRKLRFFLNLAFKEKCDDVLKLYEVDDDESAGRALDKMLGDGFLVTARMTARAHSGAGNKVYVYHFTRSLPWMDRMGYGCFHGAEISYVFGNLPLRTGYKRADRGLSGEIIGYWTRFAATGNPNAENHVDWPLYKEESDQYLKMDIEIKTGKNLRKKYCDFLESAQKGRMKESQDEKEGEKKVQTP